MKTVISIQLILAGLLNPVNFFVKAQPTGAGDDLGVTLANARLVNINRAVVSKAEYETILYGCKNLSAGASELCIDSLYNVFITVADSSLLETNAEAINGILDEFFPELALGRRHEFPGYNFVLFTRLFRGAVKPTPTQTVGESKQLCSQKSEECESDLSTAMIIAVFRLLESAVGLSAPCQSKLVPVRNDAFQKYPEVTQHGLCDLPGKPEIFHPP